MDFNLSETEVRVLGALIEKETTTPEYYPLTLNSLMSACNQKSNRDPVMSLDEETLQRALDSLKGKRLVWHLTSGRATKYDHNIRNILPVSDPEIAVLCVLMLRGPQTLGEIKNRTERMHRFSSMDQVQETIDSLTQSSAGPLVTELPRQPGQKEIRFMHLLSGEPEIPHPQTTQTTADERSVAPVSPSEPDRITSLENTVAELRRELEELKTAFSSFREQLGG